MLQNGAQIASFERIEQQRTRAKDRELVCCFDFIGFEREVPFLGVPIWVGRSTFMLEPERTLFLFGLPSLRLNMGHNELS